MTKHAANATRIDKTFSTIQNEMKNSYSKLKIAKIINFQVDKKVPRISGHPYLMDKDKDINRQRPVIPGYNNGSAKAQRIISRALNLYIKNTKAATKNMHIWDPTKLRHHLQKETNRLQRNVKHGNIEVHGGDIKDFFPSIPYNHAMTSLRFFLQIPCKQERKYIMVPKSKNLTPTFTNNNQPRKNAYIITKTMIIEFIEWALKNNYFKMGNGLYLLNQGLPMGLGISAPLANIVAIVDMEHWKTHNPNKYKQIGLTRYVDDIIIIIIFKQGEKRMATRFLHQIFNDKPIFKKPLRLIREKPNDDGSLNFLEANVKIINNEIITHFYNKNHKFVQHGHIRYKKFTNVLRSQEPNNRIRGKLLGTFTRMRRLTDNKFLLMPKILLQCIQELLLHNVAPRTIKSCLQHMNQIHNDCRFVEIANIF